MVPFCAREMARATSVVAPEAGGWRTTTSRGLPCVSIRSRSVSMPRTTYSAPPGGFQRREGGADGCDSVAMTSAWTRCHVSSTMHAPTASATASSVAPDVSTGMTLTSGWASSWLTSAQKRVVMAPYAMWSQAATTAGGSGTRRASTCGPVPAARAGREAG